MQIETTPIEGLLIIKPKVFFDSRGYFYENYNEKTFEDAGLTNLHFAQDNQSLSQAGILRGLHYQKPPHQQGKLVRVIKGAVLDVAVDVRKNSPTYGQHYKIELTEENFLMFWIPPGFAHGFLTLKNDTIFSYKCTGIYNKSSEDGIIWNDPQLNIDWGITDPALSDKDKENIPFQNLNSPF